MHGLSSMQQDITHVAILKDKIADAQKLPSYGNWGGGIVKQYQLPWHGLTVFVFWHDWPEVLGFQANMEGQLCKVQEQFQRNSKETGQALHTSCIISAPQSVEGFRNF